MSKKLHAEENVRDFFLILKNLIHNLLARNKKKIERKRITIHID
jgi:hypothetical protein